MSDQDWDLVIAVHLKGAYSCTKACWPLFRQQKVSYNYLKCSNKMTYFQKQFGRIVNTASAAGLYGNMGQANYSAAKSEILEIQPVSYQSFPDDYHYSGVDWVHSNSGKRGSQVRHQG